ncbi:MAG: DUF5716 family protein [Bacilli bacterium]|nr:DUF5716 family protein [Bacilli bacterium]
MTAGRTDLFDIINRNFFGLLSGQNKEVNFLLLCETDRAFGSSLTTLSRKKLVDILAEYIRTYALGNVGDIGESEEHEFGVTPDNDPNDKGNSPREKAGAFVHALESRGWLEREIDENFNPIVSRTGAFLAVFNALLGLLRDEDDPNEYAASLLSLYRNVEGFDYQNATASLQAIQTDSETLSRSLLSINSRIKRFVGKAMGDNTLTEKAILQKLAVDYQRLNAYVAFHNLLTRNNPNKYSGRIITKLEEMRAPENFEKLVDDYIYTKALNKDSPESRRVAERYIHGVIEMVIEQMNNIEFSLTTISSRNRTYVSNSSERIRFRLTSERDIKGDIQSLLKIMLWKMPGEDFDYGQSFQMHKFNQLDSHSPYTARSLARIAPKELPFNPIAKNQSAIEKAAMILQANDKYAPEAVFEFLDGKFGSRTEMKASELGVEGVDEFIFMMLAPAYCSAADTPYSTTTPLGVKFNCLGYDVEDYMLIRRK